jgi:hypothetical protein
MTKEEFIVPMKKLSVAYKGRFALDPNDDKDVRSEVLGTWYEFLGEYDLEDFNDAANEWIKTQQTAPTIKDLLSATRKFMFRKQGYGV